MGILKALQDLESAAGAARIAARLLLSGIELQPRTVRLYLLQLDREGFTRFVSRRRGRELTERGREELSRGEAIRRVGFVASRIDALGYEMDFDLATGKGSVIANIACIPRIALARALEDMRSVFIRRLSMGSKLLVAKPGQSIGHFTAPPDHVAMATVCSVTVNGILLGRGIPVASRFGGLLEMREGKPVRFLELIDYRGTTIDPLEFFIKANMTRVRECARTGTGIIGVSFREIPSEAAEETRKISAAMDRGGLQSIMAVGKPGQPLLDIPVSEGRTGLIMMGGLNPIAALHEAGARVTLQSLACLQDFSSFSFFQEVRDRFPG